MKWNTMKIATLILIIVVTFLTLFYSGDILGLSPTIDSDYITLVPGLFIFIIGAGATWTVRGVYQFASMSCVGIGVAILIGDMHTLGLVTEELLAGLTLAQLQLWTIVISGIAGGIIVASNG